MSEDTKEKQETTTIIVNARPNQTDQKRLSYEEIVSLAYDGNPPVGPNWEFTVDYSKGPDDDKQGSLLSGKSVRVKDGMVFNVTATDKS